MVPVTAFKASGTGKPSLADAAYSLIKKKILTLTYEPGSYLNEASLSESLDIGRNPVHHAVKRLTLEGLIETIPRKGFIVKTLSIRELKEIVDMRLVNEVYCARLAAERMSEGQLEEISDILARTRISSEAQDTEQLMLLDQQFHSLLSKAAGNQVLASILRNLHDRSLRYWFISLNEKHHGESVREEHHNIYEAIKKRDADLAAQCMRVHIEGFRKNIIKCI